MKQRKFALMIGFLIVMVFTCSVCMSALAASTTPLSFTTTTLTGQVFSSRIIKNYDLTMSNLWAEWCGLCVNEMPDLEKIHQKYPNVLLIGAFDGYSVSNAIAIANGADVTYALINCPDEMYDYIEMDEDGYAIPQTIFFDRNGKQLGSAYVGSRSYSSWATIVEQKLKEVSSGGNSQNSDIEGIRKFVTRNYAIILGRNPDEGGLNYWANALQNGTKAAANIVDDFVNSPEFKSRNLSNADKVEILYKTMLDRGPDAAGKAYWVNNLEQGQPLAAIINGFCNAPEFINICNSYGIKPGSVTVPDAQAIGKRAKIEAFVTRCYSIILGRQPDAAGLNHWANSLENGTKAASNIIDDFINSPEFRNRGLSNAATIEILYKTMLNRAPDAAGTAYWENLLNQGQPFAVIINGFCSSPEFIAICNEYGIKPGSVAVKGASEYVTPEAEEVPIAETPVESEDIKPVPEEETVVETITEPEPTDTEPAVEEAPTVETIPDAEEPAAEQEPAVEEERLVTEEILVVEALPDSEKLDTDAPEVVTAPDASEQVIEEAFVAES